MSEQLKIKKRILDAFKTEEGKYTVGQKPNLPAWIWIGGAIVAYLVNNPTIATISTATSYAGGLWWGWLEMQSGINLFRRMMGVIVFIVISLLIIAHIVMER